MWLRAHDLQGNVTFQTDWGQEFGGDNLTRMARLCTRCLHPLGRDVRRYPLGSRGYNGRVDRSHRTDDEEFYRPYLLHAKDAKHFLSLGLHWVYFYNVIRPHFGKGTKPNPSLDVLDNLGHNGPARLAGLRPIILDDISTDLVLACHKNAGNDLLAKCN